MKKVAALLIAGEDEVSLRMWIGKYSECYGPENLYIYLEGLDRKVPEFCAGVNCHCVDFGECGARAAKSRRRKYLSERAAELYDAGYNRVVFL